MCDAEATSQEHIPPKCLFPKKKDLPVTHFRENIITVPSCDVHNSAKSKDDEYLLFVLISHFNNNNVAKSQFQTKILRAIKRRPSLLSIYTKKIKDVLLNGANTIAFKFERWRIERELDHIARGLYYHEFSHKWDKSIAIYSPAMMAMEAKNASFFNRKTQEMAKYAYLLFSDQPRKGPHQEVFWYQIHFEQVKSILIIRMCFYQGVEVIIRSDPTC